MTVFVAAGVGGGSSGGFDPAGTAAGLMAAHLAAANGDAHAARATQPIRSQAGNYTLALSDLGWLLKLTDATRQFITVPAGVFAQYDLVYVRSYGFAGFTLVQGAGVTIHSPSLVLSAQFVTAAIHFDGPAEATLSPPLT